MDDIDAHVLRYKECYSSGVLDPTKHARLVGELESIVTDAHIPKQMVYTKLSDFCGEEERCWVRALRKLPLSENGGLVYSGACGDVGVKMFALAGCFLRNFVRAQVFTIQEVIEVYKKGGTVDATVLLIPNFFYRQSSGGRVPDWQTSLILGMLYSRYAKGQQTVIYVEDMRALSDDYGAPFKSHITNHFKNIID